MKKILNPYPKYPGYNCFGCSPKNDIGLKMEFVEEDDAIICYWTPVESLQGYYNILHGGIQAALIDEIGSWYVQVKLKTAGLTSNLNIRYLNPVSIIKGDIFLRATLKNKRRNLVDIYIELKDFDGKLCAKGDATYFTFTPEVAKRDFNYPEHDEFFDQS